jgi:tetratricopeptide (TPR) repeat protein
MSEKASFPAMDEGDSDQATAVAMALAGASRSEADAYLRDQRHHLREQLKQIHLGLWEVRLGVFLRLATAVVGVAVAAALSWFVWQASESNGLIVEPFSVPPDMAARGLTGEVVAAKVLDRLVALQAQTNSGRPAKSYANAWGEHGIKLEIPETGISLNELDDWLRAKLGHDSRVSGEVIRSEDGLSLTARTAEGSETVAGAEKDLTALVGELAERVYRATQPFRYGMYLAAQPGRGAESLAVFQDLAMHGDPVDRLWAYNRWAAAVGGRDGVDAGLHLLDQAIAIDPESIGAYDNRGSYERDKGWPEQALHNYRDQLTHLNDGRQTYVPHERMAVFRRAVESRIAASLGAFHDAEPVLIEMTHTGYPGYNANNIRTPLIIDEIGAHELAAARATLAELEALLPPPPGAPRPNYAIQHDMRIALAGENWTGVLALEPSIVEAARTGAYGRSIRKTMLDPMLAVAEAGSGRFAAAEKRAAAMPADCYDCLLAHARIAEMQHQSSRADGWFARAEAQGPSLPFANAAWGQALLARGQPDAAIEKFKLSNAKGPHFADSLEGWGEALMAKNQSHLALAKFAEADKYAPDWGRLHLKWGEALMYAGKRDDANAQFSRAAALDLTPTEKAELARSRNG